MPRVIALAAALLLVTAGIGAVLLGLELFAVIKKRAIFLAVIALVLGLIDILVVGGLWSGWSSTRDDFSSGELPAAFPIAATLLMIAQVAVAVWAFVSRNQRTLDSGVR